MEAPYALPPVIAHALEQPNGARFFRCALQVNPYAYLGRHGKDSAFDTEAQYNQALIEACQRVSIEAIAVTDHFRIRESRALIEAAQKAGIFVFPGFEAAASDGMHFLCLYDPDRAEAIERYIGDLGVTDSSKPSPLSKFNSSELPRQVRQQGGIAIAAHACASNGILKHLKGQPRIDAWKSPDLLACAIAGTVEDTPQECREILMNKNADHRRQFPLAIIQANDVNKPEDLDLPQTSCYLKMGRLSVEGLRQAFLDPGSRIKRIGEAPTQPAVELVALTWEGGFLDGETLHFNGGLNVLIGGRGTGKTSVIESLRYVLGIEPLGAAAQQAQQNFVRHVLKSGTRISLLAKVRQGTDHSYLIERTVPNPPTVTNQSGEPLDLGPLDVLGRIEIYGQHEIAELAHEGKQLARLLDRFAKIRPDLPAHKSSLKLALEKSRNGLVTLKNEISVLEERLSELPKLEETLKRYQQAGLENLLGEKSRLVSEERLLKTLAERLVPLESVAADLAASLPLDAAFLTPQALEGLPNAALLAEGQVILEELAAELLPLNTKLEEVLKKAAQEIESLRQRWDKGRQQIEADYQAKLRQLHRDNIDGNEFVRLRQQIESLLPLKEKLDRLRREWDTVCSQRQALLDEQETLWNEEFNRLEQAARSVNQKLKGRIRIEVVKSDDLQPLEQLLKSEVGGNLNAFIQQLAQQEGFSPRVLAEACQHGTQELINSFGAAPAVAKRLVEKGYEWHLTLEELEIPASMSLQLNTAEEGHAENWQYLEALSAGQKATAVLLLLLLESKFPLVIDQPEDDLDNRFITEGIVPLIRREKAQRQLILASHNANIPVLGDAELIIGLKAESQTGTGPQGKVQRDQIGSIDLQPTRHLVETVLEGGKTAFETRRQKYGF